MGTVTWFQMLTAIFALTVLRAGSTRSISISYPYDLTLLDSTQQLVELGSRQDVMVDFRVVRTGRISGVVWLGVNENGKLDEGEQPLPDVRVVPSSGRDTLTDEKGTS